MKAYISCPLGESWGKVIAVEKHLINLGYEVTKFVRGNCYIDCDLREADIFVLISENNQFDFFQKDMTAGCKKELDIAVDMQKPLHLAQWKGGMDLIVYPISEYELMKGRVIGSGKDYLQPVSTIINQFPIY